MSVVDRSFDQPLKCEEHAAGPLAGGLLQNGYQCGMLWGAALAAGARAYQLYGSGPQAEARAVMASQRLVESFRARNRYLNCAEITEIEWKPTVERQILKQVLLFFAKGGPVLCFSMAARYASAAYCELNTSFTEKAVDLPASSLSCTALLARKMGLSDQHVVMAAGLAGGIGLSGGACGALGAAIWITGMKNIRAGVQNEGLNLPGADAILERFLESSDYEFECAKIVGRTFENIEDHACHLSSGGCAKIIEALCLES